MFFTNTVDGKLRGLFLFGLTLAGFILATTANPVKRDVDTTNPCFSGTGEAETPNFPTVLEDLKERSRGIDLLSEDIRHYTSEFIRNMSLGGILTHLDNYSFVTRLTEENIAQDEMLAFIDLKAMLMSHWSHLFNLTTLLNYVRTHGIIGSSEFNNDSSESKLRNQLDTMETRIDSLMCDVYMGLRSQGVTQISEVTTPEFQFPGSFTSSDGRLHYELYRVYVLMNDTNMVAGFLNKVYNKI